MPSRKRRRPTTLAIILMTVISCTAVAGLAVYVTKAPNGARVPQEEHRNGGGPEMQVTNRRAAPNVKVEPIDETEAVGETAQVLTPRYKGDDLTFTREKRNVPADEDAKTFALREFLKKANVTPAGTRLLSVSVSGGVATLSFNKNLYGGYGSDDERTLINGIAEVLKQFPDVKKAVLVVDGEAVDSLGHLEITDGILVQGSSSTPPQP
jgi:spore germination protein GerM